MADNRLIERLVEQQVAKRIAQLESQLSVQHCLLTELVRHLPRHAVLDAARSLHALRMQKQPCEGGKIDPFGPWWIYLCQTAGLVEAERADMPKTYQFQ